MVIQHTAAQFGQVYRCHSKATILNHKIADGRTGCGSDIQGPDFPTGALPNKQDVSAFRLDDRM